MKFENEKIRDAVLRKKKALKDDPQLSRIIIRVDLTVARSKLLRSMLNLKEQRNCTLCGHLTCLMDH